MIAPLDQIQALPHRVKQSSFKDFGIRFLFGGLITAAVGVIAKAYGPSVAGLFLAFPAILPASLTLIAKHDRTRAAGADAIGAVSGSIGLAVFGALVWLMAPRYPGWLTILVASIVWLVVSIGVWMAFTRVRHADRPG